MSSHLQQSAFDCEIPRWYSYHRIHYCHCHKSFFYQTHTQMHGGFQLVDLIITELKDDMTCYKFECSHWWKIYLLKKNPLQDLLSSLNAVISTNENTRILTGHVIYNPAQTYKFQLKTTMFFLFNIIPKLLPLWYILQRIYLFCMFSFSY